LDDTVAGVASRAVPAAQLPGMEPCGPRRKIFFDPAKTRAAIVTCGGLCPGLNDVIAGLVRSLTYHYRVRRVVGIRNGYQGFCAQTAVSLASDSIRAAQVEAKSTANGVGLVKLMGRHSGFIACYAVLARSGADVVLIPEVPFALDGEHGLLAHLRRRVAE